MENNEIIMNPNLIMLFEDDCTIDQIKLGISKRPSLIDTISNDTYEVVKVAFENGYYSDKVAKYIDTYGEDEICSFISKTNDEYLKIFLEVTENLVFTDKMTLELIKKDYTLYNQKGIKKSDEIDWEILNSIEYLDAKMKNPLTFMCNLTQEKVDFLYNKFGKLALVGISSDFQTYAMAEEILQKSAYDYPFVYFTEDVAKLFVSEYVGTVAYAMAKSKVDPYYDTRVLRILSVYGAALQYVEKQTEEMQLIAVKNNPMSIEYAITPSESVQIVAIQGDIDCGELISNKTKRVCDMLGIDYVKPSKYDKNKKYFVALSLTDTKAFMSVEGDKIDELLAKDSLIGNCKISKLAKVTEMDDEEEKVLKKFGFFKSSNPFVE